MKLPVASHSFLNDWGNCPRKAYRKYIKKDLPKQPQTKEMAWGNEVHSAFERRIGGYLGWPIGMEKFEVIARPLVDRGARAELALGIKQDGMMCDFWAKDVWLRGKIDASMVQEPVAAIFDWKTGKRRENKAELEVHGVLLKAFFPKVQRIYGHYVWLQDREVGKAHDVSDTETKLAEIRSVMNTVRNCMEIEDFPARPNLLCGGEWGSCPVTDCEHRRGPSR
jgi:hypothetical protein